MIVSDNDHPGKILGWELNETDFVSFYKKKLSQSQTVFGAELAHETRFRTILVQFNQNPADQLD